MEYKKFTPEQLDRAKNADIIAFLGVYMGLEFKASGKYYKCSQHNSLIIYPNRKRFVWNSRNISGSDMIDFLRNAEGKSFPEAVEIIIGENAAATYTPAPKYKAEAGRAAVEKYTSKYRERGYEVKAVFSQSKDVNEDLINKVSSKARR